MLKPKEKNLNIEKIDFKPPPKEPPNKLIVNSIIKRSAQHWFEPRTFCGPKAPKGVIALSNHPWGEERGFEKIGFPF